MHLNELSKIATHIQTISKQTNRLQRDGITFQSKADRTVVTKADYFVQAAITYFLSQHTPDIPILAEETLEGLRSDPNILVDVDRMLSQMGCPDSAERLLSISTHEPRYDRHWVLDPIDGTRGFIRGDQYAMALGLVEGSQVLASILCCPRLLYQKSEGVTLLCHRDTLVCLTNDKGTTPSAVSTVPRSQNIVLTESLELGPRTETFTNKLKKHMGWTEPTLRLDSQAKYGAIAIGAADVYLRLPRAPDTFEFSWDHAAGAQIVTSSGGTVTDLDGRPLDFSHGSTLKANRGILATRCVEHQKVLDALATLGEPRE